MAKGDGRLSSAAARRGLQSACFMMLSRTYEDICTTAFPLTCNVSEVCVLRRRTSAGRPHPVDDLMALIAVRVAHLPASSTLRRTAAYKMMCVRLRRSLKAECVSPVSDGADEVSGALDCKRKVLSRMDRRRGGKLYAAVIEAVSGVTPVFAALSRRMKSGGNHINPGSNERCPLLQLEHHPMSADSARALEKRRLRRCSKEKASKPS